MNVDLIKSIFRSTKKWWFHVRKLRFYIRGNRFGTGAYVSSNVQLRKCIIGSYTSIGPNSVMNRAIIGQYCSFASDVMIGGEEHAYWDISTSNYLTEKGVTELDTIIGHDVWIGAQCYIRQGVKIGNGAVIGSNSFVNKDIPDYAIVAGSPARVIKYRFDDVIINAINESKYWEYPPKKAKQIIENINNTILNI